MTGGNAGGLDIAQFPGQQDAQKQQNGKADPKGQRFGHVAGFGGAVTAISHHEDQGRDQTAQDGYKGQSD